jgi:hypothetical protein
MESPAHYGIAIRHCLSDHAARRGTQSSRLAREYWTAMRPRPLLAGDPGAGGTCRAAERPRSVDGVRAAHKLNP